MKIFKCTLAALIIGGYAAFSTAWSVTQASVASHLAIRHLEDPSTANWLAVRSHDYWSQSYLGVAFVTLTLAIIFAREIKQGVLGLYALTQQ